jgi:transketolase
MSSNSIKQLEQISKLIRIDVIDMLYKIGSDYKGHPGPALSIIDLVTCLYFKILKVDPKKPKWEERDRLILSKGHACPAIYAALAMKGFFDKSHLYTFRHVNSILQGHPDMRKTPGIDITAGSLGHGLAAGIGMALAAKLDKKNYKVYVILGDGEVQEGLVWEAFMFAGHHKLNNLIAIIDRNRWQSCDEVKCTIDIEPLVSKIRAFNWKVLEIDGHKMNEILTALSEDKKSIPLAIIANTIKGKGVSFMEEDNSWHQKALTDEQYKIAMNELRG